MLMMQTIYSFQVSAVIHALASRSAPTSVVVRALCALLGTIMDRNGSGSSGSASCSGLYPMLSTVCSDQVRRELVHRVGILNLWSPQCPGE